MALNKFGMGFVLSAQDTASKVFNKVGGGFNKMTGGIERDARRQQNAMANIAVGGSMLLFSKSVFDGFNNALKMSKELNTALAEVSTLTDEASFAMSDMAKITSEAASKYGEDQVKQTQALYSIISAGFGEAEQAANLLSAANEMAVAGVSDVATSVDGLTNMMNNFRDKSANAISDEMFTAVKAGKTTIDELAGSVGKLAPLWESLGGSSASMLGAIATVTTKGIVTTEAISGLKAALQGVMKPTGDAVKEAKRLGVEFNVAALKSKGLVEVLNDVTGSAKFNDETFTKLFGSVEGLNAALALASQDGAKYAEIMDMMKNSSGATAEAFRKMTNSLAFQDKRFKTITDNIQRIFGESLERILLPFAKGLVRVAEGFEKWMKSLPPEAIDTLTSVVSVIAAVVGLVGGLLVLKGTLGLLGISFSGLVSTMSSILIGGPAIIILFGGLAVATYAAYKAFQRNTGSIAWSWQEMVSKIKIAWRALVSIIKNEQFSEELQSELNKAGNEGLGQFIEGMANFIVKIKHFWRGLKAGFDEGINRLVDSDAFKRLRESFGGVFDLFTNGPMDASQNQLEEWANKGVEAGLKIAKLGEMIFDATSSAIEFGKRFTKAMSSVTAEDINQGINTTIEIFKDLVTILQFTATVMGFIVDVAKVLVNSIQVVGAVIGETLANWLSNLGHLGDAVMALIDGDFKGASAAASQFDMKKMLPGGIAFSVAEVLMDENSETTKRSGDLIRNFDPESTVGLGEEIKAQQVSDLQVLQADSVDMIKNARLKGESDKEQVELLRQVNVMLEQLVGKPQPPVNVLLNTKNVSSILEKHLESESDRDLDGYTPVHPFG
jgi:TP901 family phage tail tape measure protein